jgi:ribosome-associated protein
MNSLEKQISTTRKARKRSTPNPAHVLAAHAVDAMFDKKARDIAVMDMRGISGVADFFVIGTGDSDLQIRAVAEAIRERIRERCDERPWHSEGMNNWQWVLLDYVDVVAHIFSPEKRAFYDLERLWGDAPIERVAEEGSATDVKLLESAASDGASDHRKAGGEG